MGVVEEVQIHLVQEMKMEIQVAPEEAQVKTANKQQLQVTLLL